MRLVGPARRRPARAGELRRRGRIDRAFGQAGETRLGERDQGLVIDLAGGDQDQAAGAIEVAAPGVEIVDLDRGDARLVAEDRAAERLVGIGGRPEIVEDDVRRRVARLAQFLQHDLLLAGEVGRARNAGAATMSESSSMPSGRCSASREAVKLVPSRSVQALRSPPTSSTASLDLARRAAARALEHHMLEQMGEAVEPRRLVARAGIGVEADRDGLEAGHRPARDLEPAVEDGELHHAARN